MSSVHVFDPALCCSSGVCGTSVDPQLARFAADLDWLKTQGVTVERFNLAQQPAPFAADDEVRSALEARGEAALPLVKINGEVKSVGTYPSREDLAAWTGVGAPTAVAVASGAATGGCCAPTSAGKTAASTKSGCC